MARPRTLRSTIERIGDRQLISFWQLRSVFSSSTKEDKSAIRAAIVGRIKYLKTSREKEIAND